MKLRNLTPLVVGISLAAVAGSGCGGCGGGGGGHECEGSGCECEGSGCGDGLTIEFTAPDDGATLGPVNDTDATEPGIQYTVVVHVEGVEGAFRVAIAIEGESDPLAQQNIVADGDVSFPSVTLPDGELTLVASVFDGAAQAAAAIDRIDITVRSESTTDASLEITSPMDGATLDLGDDADGDLSNGMQVRVDIAGEEIPDGTDITLTWGDALTDTAPMNSGLVAFDDVTLGEGVQTLTASATVDGADVTATADVTVPAIPEPQLTFSAPGDGATLGPADDNDGDITNGLQVDVVIEVSDLGSGGDVVLDVNGEEEPQGFLDEDGTVTFEDVTIPEGESTLHAVATWMGLTAEGEVDVTVETPNCTAALAPMPTAGACEATVDSEDADLATPGFQIDFAVNTDCEEAELFVDGESVGTAAAAGGIAEFPGVTLEEGERTVRVDVSAASGQSGTSGDLTYTVDTIPPTVTLDASLAGVILPDADTDGALDGLQMDVFGTSDAGTGSPVEVFVDGSSVGETDVDGAGQFRLTAVTFDESRVYVVSAIARDGCENPSAEVTTTFEVIAATPVLSILSPLNESLLGVGDDVDFVRGGLQALFQVAAPGLSSGATAQIECRTNFSSPFTVRSTEVFSADDSAQLVVSLEEGATQCRARVSDPLDLLSEVIDIYADTSAPVVTINAPGEGEAFDSATVQLDVSLTGNDPGATGWYRLNGGDQIPVDGSGEGFVMDLAAAEGANSVTVHVDDLVGLSGEAMVGFFVDTIAPTLAAVFPTEGETLEAGDIVNTGGALTFSPILDVGGVEEGSLLCVGTNGGAPACVPAETVGLVTLPGVPLVPGANVLDASLTDALGNPTALDVNFTLDIALPRVEITAPGDATVAGSLDPFAVAGLTDLREGTLVQLFVNDVQVDEQPTDSTGEVDFAGAIPVEGANEFYLTGSDARGLGRSPTYTYIADVTAPVVTILTPADGAIFNIASPDASGDAGFQQDVAVHATDANIGTTATLYVDCGGWVLTEALDGDGDAAFAGVTLPDAADCEVRAEVTDLAGNLGSGSIHVTIDRTAPFVAWSFPTDGGVVTMAADASGDPGLQIAGRVSVTGGDPGRGADAEFTWAGGSASSSSAAMTGTDETLDLSVVMLPDGSAIATANFTDAAGNAADPASIAFLVASDAAGATILAPLEGVLNIADDLGAAPGLQVDVGASVAGEYDGATGVLCIETADSGSYPVACAQPGYRQLATAPIASGTLLFTEASLPEGAVRLTAEIDLGPGTLIPGLNTVTYTVDSVAPIATGISVASDTDSDGRLNLAESEGAAGVADVTTTFTGMENGRPASVLLDGATSLGSSPVAGGASTLRVSLADGTWELSPSASDAAGNPIEAPVPTTTITVDTLPPALAFAAPADGASLLVAQDADANPANGLQYDVSLTTTAEDGQDVTVSLDGGVTLGTFSAVGGIAAGRVTLPEGSVTLAAAVTDVAGNPGTAPAITVLVDSVAPSIEFAAPTPGSSTTVGSGDDADGATFGLQYDVSLTIADAEAGRPLTITSSATGGAVSPAGTTVSGSNPQIVRLTLPGGTHLLTATTSDANGNPASSATITLTYPLAGCGLSWIQPSTTPTAVGELADADGDPDNGVPITFIVAVENVDCLGETATLAINGTDTASATVAADGRATFPGVVLGNLTTNSVVVSTAFGPGSSTPATVVNVDIEGPLLISVDATPAAPGNLINLSNSGTGGAGFADFEFTAAGATSDTWTITSSLSGPVASGTITPGTFTAAGVPLVDGSQTLTFELSDGINTVSIAETWTIDMTAPPTPSVTFTTVNPRSGHVRATWAPDTSGETVQYLLRRGTADLSSDAAWSAATPVGSFNFPFSINGSGNIESNMTNLAFQSTHYFGVRAIDDGGNVSPIVTGSAFIGVRPESYATTLTSVESVTPLGDINNDGFDDIATFGVNNPVVILYGAADASMGTAQSLPAVAGSGSFGFWVHGPGDVNGDGIADVAVAAPGTTPDGTVYIYFGRDGAQLATAPSVTVTLDDGTGTNALLSINRSTGRGNVSDASGEAIDDILLSATSANTTAGVAFLILGRSDWGTGTLSLTLDGTANNAFDVVTFSGTTAVGRFGRWTAFLGDIDSSGYSEMLVTSHSAGIPNGRGSYYVGRDLADFAAAGLLDTDAEALISGAGGATNWGLYGVASGFDWTGDGLPDFAIASEGIDTVYFFAGGDPLATSAYWTWAYSDPGLAVEFGRPIWGVSDVDERNGDDLLVRARPSIAGSGFAGLSLNPGDGRFTTSALITLPGVDPLAVGAAGDFNDDGHADFALVLSDKTVVVYH